MRQVIKTTKEEVIAYWETNKYEGNIAVDWSEAHERCWRCGYKSKQQMCHIIPASLGGPDEPSNFVLLCHRCHREAPNHSNSKYMWLWIERTCTAYYDTYWTDRGVEEFKKMFKRNPFEGPEFSDFEFEMQKDELLKEFDKVIIHFGEGRLNPSTIACIFAEFELKFISLKN